MTWCNYCGKDCQTGRDYATGSICCVDCGKLIGQDLFADEPTFTKGPGGESRLAGTYVKILGDASESHERTLEKGYTVIRELIAPFGITDVCDPACRFYRIAVERSFTKGRRTSQVAAACLYIACREKGKPFLLIDFSSLLNISVYELGGVYLQLCMLLSLQDHDFVQQPVDPSLYMHRFTTNLIKGDDSKKVLRTALQFIVSMKRDWMQTGRKPSGICGVALYVSTIVHGLNISKSDILKVVHICDATFTKRLIEFENTKSGSLTIEEFNQTAEEYDTEQQVCKQSDKNLKELAEKKEAICKHKDRALSGYGLCNACYMEFCGGFEGGSDPPAFQRAEMERLLSSSSAGSSFDLGHQQEISISENGNGGRLVAEGHQDRRQNVKACVSEPKHAYVDPGNENTTDAIDCIKDMPANEDETDTLSDIDDVEVNCYLNNEEESRFKKIIWEQMNKEYVQEQAAKEAAAAAVRKLYSEASDEVRSAQELAAAAAAAVAKSREKRRQKRADEAKNTAPAQTAAEATRQMLTKKRLSSKINYEALDDLFADSEPITKKGKGGDDKKLGKQENETIENFDEQNDEDEDIIGKDAYGEEDDPTHYGNGQEMYDYDYNDQDGYDDDDEY